MGLGAGTGVTLRVRWLGRLAYREAWDLQRALADGRRSGRSADDYLLLLEHPHVFTIGRNGDESNLLVGPSELADAGAELLAVDRGGDITYHGPGQIVGYPIVELDAPPDVVGHVRRMEQALIATLAGFGIEAWAEDGYTGVWTSRGKVGAIGVHVSRRVTTHGFALNVDPDPAYFAMINPCGLHRPVTSMRELAGRPFSVEEVVKALVPCFAATFGYAAVETQMGAFTRGASGDYDVDTRIAAGAFSAQERSEHVPVSKGRLTGEPERPPWMKVTANLGDGYRQLKGLMDDLQLNTVCQEAACPNIYECWGAGTATLMLLGDVCTRACSFCDVATGRPGDVDPMEPFRAAAAVEKMGLEHAVLTSVNRDDLEDGGASIFAATIREIRRRLPDCAVEVLIPDFKGDWEALQTVMDAGPDVLNHNTETVLRLQRDVRTAASYGRSLALLARAKAIHPGGTVKSGLIVGMGESDDEVHGALSDLAAVGVDIVTIGQYLRPSPRHRPITRYVHPDTFREYAEVGRSRGIPHVEAGPLVRSSYHAREATLSAGRTRS